MKFTALKKQTNKQTTENQTTKGEELLWKTHVRD